jgi:hypothetical protein
MPSRFGWLSAVPVRLICIKYVRDLDSAHICLGGVRPGQEVYMVQIWFHIVGVCL